MTMLYKLANGRVKDENYGLTLARFAQLPQSVVSRAKIVSEALVNQRELAKQNSKKYNMVRSGRVILRFTEHLKEARDGRMENTALKRWLITLRTPFVARLEALGIGDEGVEDESRTERGDTMSTATATATDSNEGNGDWDEELEWMGFVEEIEIE